MERALRRRGFDRRVLNTGISSLSTAEELASLENEGIRDAPDAVMFGFFAIDFEDNLKEGLSSTASPACRGSARTPTSTRSFSTRSGKPRRSVPSASCRRASRGTDLSSTPMSWALPDRRP